MKCLGNGIGPVTALRYMSETRQPQNIAMKLDPYAQFIVSSLSICLRLRAPGDVNSWPHIQRPDHK